MTKFVFSLLALAVIVPMSFLLVGCGGGTTQESHPLEGSWIRVSSSNLNRFFFGGDLYDEDHLDFHMVAALLFTSVDSGSSATVVFDGSDIGTDTGTWQTSEDKWLTVHTLQGLPLVFNLVRFELSYGSSVYGYNILRIFFDSGDDDEPSLVFLRVNS
ncbi:MAG: hypothetical protein FWE31_03590 [Firmicutes bacterium]|nr:hypothetical protein [Bacillota bacterium]